MIDRTAIYGAGLDYPVDFSTTSGGVTSAVAIDSVRASVRRLLETAPGEELYLPEYGCALKTLLFELDTEAFRAVAETAIRDAISQWEPRIADVLAIAIDRDDERTPNLVTISLAVRLIQSQTVDNLVVPFAAP